MNGNDWQDGHDIRHNSRKLPLLGLALAFVTAVGNLSAAAAQERPAASDGPLAQAIAAANEKSTSADYAYTRHLQIDADDERVDRVERYDPRHPEGQRWQLLQVDGASPTAEDLDSYDPGESPGESQNAFELYHALVGELDLESAMLVEMTPEQALYRIDLEKGRFLSGDSREFAEQLNGRLAVDRRGKEPHISRFELWADDPFSPSFGAEIERFQMKFSYRRLPETGDVLPESVAVDISVEAMIFFSVDAMTRLAFSDYEAVSGE